VAAGALHRLFQHREADRVLGRETQLFQLPADLVHAQALGNGGVDLQGLAGDAAALVRAHHPEGAHVVQAVGQLDQDHPDVLGDRQHHLAEVLGLGLGLGTELQVGQLGDAIDQLGDLRSELGADAFLAGRGVLHHIVQDGGDDGLVVHPHLAHGAGDRQRMVDVRLPGLARLPFVRLRPEQIGPVDLVDLVRLEVGLQLSAQVADQESRGVGGRSGDGPDDRKRGAHRVLGLTLVGVQLLQVPDGAEVQHLRLRALVRLVEDLRPDQALGDLAQGDHGGLVVVVRHTRFLAVGQVAGTARGHQYQFESVVDVLEAVLDGDAGHFNSRMKKL
jgi:hypothetical protein